MGTKHSGRQTHSTLSLYLGYLAEDGVLDDEVTKRPCRPPIAVHNIVECGDRNTS